MMFVILGEWAARFRGREFDTWSEAVEAVEVELEWTGAIRYAERRSASRWLMDGETLAEVSKVAA